MPNTTPRPTSTWESTLSKSQDCSPAFAGLSKDRLLPPLTLTVNGDTTDLDNNNVDPFWGSAAQIFRITALALYYSQIMASTLDVFSSIHRCSLYCDRLDAVLDEVDLSPCLKALKHLSLSVSNSNKDERSGGVPACRLIALCPALEELSFHWFCFRGHFAPTILFSTPTAKKLNLKSLRKCRLQGIHTTGSSLRTFFRNKPQLSRLCLEGVRLTKGTFGHIIKPLQPQLEYISIQDLHQQEKAMSIRGDFYSERSFVKTGPAAKLPIRYCINSIPHTSQSGELHSDRTRSRLRCGPPRYGMGRVRALSRQGILRALLQQMGKIN